MRRRHTPRQDLLQPSSNRGYGSSGLSGVEAIFALAGFQLPLNDAGGGIVSLGLNTGGVGTATFTRASTKWTKLASGLWASVATGQPCSTYFGMTTAVGTYAGYFPELAGTQLVTPTASIRDMTDAAWVKGATVTVAKTGTGIDGVGNSCSRVTGGAVTATNTVLQTLAAAATSRTYSAWILRVTGTGAIGITQDGTTFTDISGQINSSTFTQISLNANQLNAAFGLQVSVNGDVILVDFNQFEAGANASSPMDSAGAARAADSCTFLSAGNVLDAVGTVYCEVSTLWSTAPAGSNAYGENNNNGANTPNGQAATVFGINDGSTQTNKSGLLSSATGIRKRVISWGPAGMTVTGDGATPATSAFDGTMTQGAATLGVGNNTSGANQWSGTIKSFYIWKTQLSTADQQGITSP